MKYWKAVNIYWKKSVFTQEQLQTSRKYLVISANIAQ